MKTVLEAREDVYDERLGNLSQLCGDVNILKAVKVMLLWHVRTGTIINVQYYTKILQEKWRPAIRKKATWSAGSYSCAPVYRARIVT